MSRKGKRCTYIEYSVQGRTAMFGIMYVDMATDKDKLQEYLSKAFEGCLETFVCEKVHGRIDVVMQFAVDIDPRYKTDVLSSINNAVSYAGVPDPDFIPAIRSM